MRRIQHGTVPRALGILLLFSSASSIAATSLGRDTSSPFAVGHVEHISQQSSDANGDVAAAADDGASAAVPNALVAETGASSAFVINATFDSSITSDPNAAAIEAVINNAIAVYEALFNDPMTVSIRFRYATTLADGSAMPAGALAVSTSVIYIAPWNTYISALKADATTANDAAANASLPPTARSSNILPSSAGGRAVGLNTPPAMFADGSVGSGGPYDGIITLNSSEPFKFTRPPSSGLFDAQRTIEHEMDEVLGLGSNIGMGSDLRPQDLFSWSATGVRNVTSSGSRYFSIDGGSTDIVGFNQDPSGDFGDWLSGGCPQGTPYVQNAFGCADQASDVTPTSPEGINLDVIGYDLVTTGPSTTTTTNVGIATTTSTTTAPATTTTTTTTLPELCTPTPASGCGLAALGGSSVQLKKNARVAKDVVKWKWAKGAATPVTAFKDPVRGSATYRVCLYDGSANLQPVMEMGVPPGGRCGTRPCWTALGTTGFVYRNPVGTTSGLTVMRLKAGATGTARVQVTGKGRSLSMPTLGLTLPVTVQFVARDASSTECWQTTYSTDTRNDTADFTARGP